MDIRELNDDFFTKCTIEYELGLVSLNKKGELEFTGRISGQKEIVDPSKLLLSDNRKFIKSKMRKNIQVVAKKLVNSPCAYIIANHDNLTIDGKPINIGDVVLMTNPPKLYENYKMFIMEIKTTEMPDLKKAVSNHKNGVRGNSYGVDNSNSINTEDNFSNIFDTPAKPTKASEDWSKDKDVSYKNGQYIITKSLFEETQAGGTKHWGYLLQDDSTGETLQLPKQEVNKLAGQKKIKNAKLVNKGGQQILQGIGLVLADLDQDYKS